MTAYAAAEHDTAFRTAYQSLGLLSPDGSGLPLHRRCTHCDTCWEGARNRFPLETGAASHIARPWVGGRYDLGRVLVLGENLNEHGGYPAIVELAGAAQNAVRDGWRRIRFGNSFKEYPGSMLWHRLACYTAAILEAVPATQEQIAVVWGKDGYPTRDSAARAFDFVAFTNHIKCSPTGSNSEQTAAMWQHCGPHILRRELEILQPLRVVILGNSDNAWWFERSILDSGFMQRRTIGRVLSAEGRISGREIQLYVLPHPQARGGASRTILKDLRQIAVEVESAGQTPQVPQAP